MTTQAVIDFAREALLMALTLAGPPLLAALAVGLIVGAIQTATQMSDPVLNLVPRLVAGAVAILVSLPWLLGRWIGFAVELIQSIPGRI